MLKNIARWRYGIAVGVILGCTIYVSSPYQEAREQCEKKCGQVDTGVVVGITPSAPHAENCDECEQNAERHFPGWYRAFLWPGGITTWAIILTLLALAEQTHETARAAKASQVAAESAAKTAAAYTNVERSRLFIKQRTTADANVLAFDFQAVNHGRSAAALTYYFATIKLLPAGNELPDTPVYGERAKYGRRGHEWIVPDIK